jgi:hypothetical protein
MPVELLDVSYFVVCLARRPHRIPNLTFPRIPMEMPLQAVFIWGQNPPARLNESVAARLASCCQGCPAVRDSLDSANLPAFRSLSPGRKTPSFGEGERAFRLSGYVAVATMLSDLSVGEQVLSPSMSSPDHDRTSSHNFHSALSRTLRGHQGHPG